MSALAEKIAREHQRQDGAAGDGYSSPRESWTHCSCGADIWAWQQFYAETDEDPDENWTQHIAAVTEAAVRAAVAADIEDLEHTSQQVREGVRHGRTVDYYEGYEQAIVHAARIAEGEQ